MCRALWLCLMTGALALAACDGGEARDPDGGVDGQVGFEDGGGMDAAWDGGGPDGGGGGDAAVGDASGPVAAPDALVAVTVDSSRIALSWTDHASDETGFEIEVSLDGTHFSPLATVAAGSTAHTAPGLPPLTEHVFRVRALRGTDQSDWSNAARATTADHAPNVALTLVSASPTQSVVEGRSGSFVLQAENPDDPGDVLDVTCETSFPGWSGLGVHGVAAVGTPNDQWTLTVTPGLHALFAGQTSVVFSCTAESLSVPGRVSAPLSVTVEVLENQRPEIASFPMPNCQPVACNCSWDMSIRRWTCVLPLDTQVFMDFEVRDVELNGLYLDALDVEAFPPLVANAYFYGDPSNCLYQDASRSWMNCHTMVPNPDFTIGHIAGSNPETFRFQWVSKRALGGFLQAEWRFHFRVRDDNPENPKWSIPYTLHFATTP